MAVTLPQAQQHLYLVPGTDPAADADLTLKLAQAVAIIQDYLKATSNPVDNPIVDAAVLLQLGELWRFRGDDPSTAAAPTTSGDLHPTITNLLRRLRDPALA
jgi:hypothetical protein